jgi:hypothetical protein
MRDQGGFSTRQKGGAALTLFGIGLPLLQWGLEARGVSLSPAQGNLLLVLAALSFLSGSIIILWSWVGRICSWTWRQIKQRWPFALARTARRLRTRLREAEEELQRLRPENEQLKLENRNQQVDLDHVSKELGQTKHDKANLRHECERLREQNSELRNQRDWQIRVRCRKLANGLDKLLEGWERHDPKNKEALREYNNRFKADANRLIKDLKTYDLWVPQVDDPVYLENPENRQDVQNLYNYLRWVHLGFPA